MESVKTTYSVWSVGKKDIPAGSRQRIKIKEENWPAEFLFLARPSLGQQAFVRAQIKLATPVEIPSGEALLLIDGAVLGKRNFAFAGSEGSLYFGTSPFDFGGKLHPDRQSRRQNGFPEQTDAALAMVNRSQEYRRQQYQIKD